MRGTNKNDCQPHEVIKFESAFTEGVYDSNKYWDFMSIRPNITLPDKYPPGCGKTLISKLFKFINHKHKDGVIGAYKEASLFRPDIATSVTITHDMKIKVNFFEEKVFGCENKHKVVICSCCNMLNIVFEY